MKKDYIIVKSEDIKNRINRHFNINDQYQIIVEIDKENKEGKVFCITEKGDYFEPTKESMNFMNVNFLVGNRYVDYKFLNMKDDDFEVFHYQDQPLCYIQMKPCVNDYNKNLVNQKEICKLMPYEYYIVHHDELTDKYGCIEVQSTQIRKLDTVYREEKRKYVPITNASTLINALDYSEDKNITQRVRTGSTYRKNNLY